MTNKNTTLPYGVGQVSNSLIFICIVLLALVGFGIYGYSQQLIHGEGVTGLRDIGPYGGNPLGIIYHLFGVFYWSQLCWDYNRCNDSLI